jgi:hypothetical protein
LEVSATASLDTIAAMEELQASARFVANVLIFLAVFILFGGVALGIVFAREIPNDDGSAGIGVVWFLFWSVATAGVAAVLWAIAIVLRILGNLETHLFHDADTDLETESVDALDA